jgi:uncharacterized protein YbjT (DUF2867 family)
MASTAKTALIVGATGVVGRHCLNELLRDATYARVVAIGRRACGKTHPKLAEIVTPLDVIGDIKSTDLGTIDDAFCCLGTTQKVAGNADTFRHVEVDYPRAAARLAKANGASHFLIITAIGADARSLIFYNKVKGEVEAAVTAEGLAHTSIFRPSLLLGERAEFRWKEKLSEPFMQALGVIMIGPARRLRPIHADTVARAMVRIAADPKPGVTIYPSDRIAEIGEARV